MSYKTIHICINAMFTFLYKYKLQITKSLSKTFLNHYTEALNIHALFLWRLHSDTIPLLGW